ncbi:hypothetical protein Tco_1071032, partial [Tanacetum coccineum]
MVMLMAFRVMWVTGTFVMMFVVLVRVCLRKGTARVPTSVVDGGGLYHNVCEVHQSKRKFPHDDVDGRDVCGVGPSVSSKRRCVCVPTSAADGGVLYDNVCGVDPSVFPETQHICCSVLEAVLDTRIKTPEVPAVALDIFSNTPSQQPALVSQECIPPSAI